MDEMRMPDPKAEAENRCNCNASVGYRCGLHQPDMEGTMKLPDPTTEVDSFYGPYAEAWDREGEMNRDVMERFVRSLMARTIRAAAARVAAENDLAQPRNEYRNGRPDGVDLVVIQLERMASEIEKSS